MLGSIMLGALLSVDMGGSGYAEGMSMGSQFAEQALGVAVVALFSGVVTYIIAKLVGLVFPMRVSNDEEREGLDITSHGERAWEFD
jgi:Amt family ammonium transporter